MAGTLVATANDLSAIETIKAGDYVLSTDSDTMQTTCKPVLETYIRKVDRLVHLIISGEKIITFVLQFQSSTSNCKFLRKLYFCFIIKHDLLIRLYIA